MKHFKNNIGVLLLFLYFWSRSNAKNKTSVCLSGATFLDSLLKREHYDISIRPCINKEPVIVSVGLYIVSINNIKESDMEYDIQIYFRLKWRDERLQFEGVDINDEDYIQILPNSLAEKIWMPDPYFENEMNSKRHDVMKRNELVRLYPDGTIFFSTRLTLTLSCPMNFQNFPMDKQICEIIISSYSQAEKELIYQWMTNRSETSVYTNKLTLPQFTIEDIKTRSRTDQYTVGNYTGLTVYIHFHRRVAFYLTHNYIPSFLVTCIACLSFWIDRKSVPARVGIGITTILAMTTLIIGVGQQGLPVVSYIKAIDWYYIGCFVFVFSALCEFAVVNYFDAEHRRRVERLREEQQTRSSTKAKDENKTNECSNKYGGVYGFSFGIEQVPSNKDDEDEDNFSSFTLESPLSHAIDKAVRWIYPLLFIVFNAAYMTTFYRFASHQHGKS